MTTGIYLLTLYVPKFLLEEEIWVLTQLPTDRCLELSEMERVRLMSHIMLKDILVSLIHKRGMGYNLFLSSLLSLLPLFIMLTLTFYRSDKDTASLNTTSQIIGFVPLWTPSRWFI